MAATLTSQAAHLQALSVVSAEEGNLGPESAHRR
jgi:hypothetical protein